MRGVQTHQRQIEEKRFRGVVTSDHFSRFFAEGIFLSGLLRCKDVKMVVVMIILMMRCCDSGSLLALLCWKEKVILIMMILMSRYYY